MSVILGGGLAGLVLGWAYFLSIRWETAGLLKMEKTTALERALGGMLLRLVSVALILFLLGWFVKGVYPTIAISFVVGFMFLLLREVLILWRYKPQSGEESLKKP